MALMRLVATCLVGITGLAHGLRISPTIGELREQIRRPSVGGWGHGAADPKKLYPAYNLSVPIDHFHNDSAYEPHSDEKFNKRYWFDASHYRPGGPVIVLAGGETSGEDRLPFLQKGIVAVLAEATGGIGVILEHRYYGGSFPVANLSTESLRFLTTDQALADTAYFATHVKFPGLEDYDLTAPGTPYIAYGGSYAGAFVAFLRKLYPDVFWGAISSSGVTVAVTDYWEYLEAARIYAPEACVTATQKLTHVVDNILLGNGDAGAEDAAKLRDAFGLGDLTHDDDFAKVISRGIHGLQSTNWDPEVGKPWFGQYCGNVSSDDLLYPDTEHLNTTARELLAVGGYADEVDELANRLLNYIGYVNVTAVARCKESQDECFTMHNNTFWAQDDLAQEWRAWEYQVCTQWGYFETGSGVPKDQLPLLSRLVDLEYSSIICRAAFNITTPPDIDAVNKHGGFDFSYPRVALLDGEVDPWRAATPHKIGLPDRKSTVSEPFILIKDGVHHWDENGRFANETTADLPPKPVREAQRQEVDFVKAWLEEWRRKKASTPVFDEL